MPTEHAIPSRCRGNDLPDEAEITFSAVVTLLRILARAIGVVYRSRMKVPTSDSQIACLRRKAEDVFLHSVQRVLRRSPCNTELTVRSLCQNRSDLKDQLVGTAHYRSLYALEGR